MKPWLTILASVCLSQQIYAFSLEDLPEHDRRLYEFYLEGDDIAGEFYEQFKGLYDSDNPPKKVPSFYLDRLRVVNTELNALKKRMDAYLDRAIKDEYRKTCFSKKEKIDSSYHKDLARLIEEEGSSLEFTHKMLFQMLLYPGLIHRLGTSKACYQPDRTQ